MHVNLEPGRHVDLRSQDLDRSTPRRAPLPRADSAPARIGDVPDVPKASVTGRSVHHTEARVHSPQLRMDAPGSMLSLRCRQSSSRSRAGSGPAKDLRGLVKAMHQARPHTPQAFLQALDAAKLEDQAPDPTAAARLFEIAAHCVERQPGGKAKARALGMCTMLYGAPASKAFAHLSPQRVAVDLMTRIVAPERIDQKGYGLCGPAAFMMHLAKNAPEAYARAATDLLMTGKAQIGGLKLEPQKSIKEYDSRSKVADADWLMLAGLSNEDGVVAKELSGELGTYGGSNMKSMFNWLKSAGLPSVMSVPVYNSFSPFSHKAGVDASKAMNPVLGAIVKVASPMVLPAQYHPSKPDLLDDAGTPWRGPDSIALAGDLARRGWKVFVTINESVANPRVLGGLQEQVPIFREMAEASGDPEQIARWSRSPEDILGGLATEKINQDPRTNHWALLDKADVREDGRVSVTVYSYGRKSTLPPVAMEDFLKIYGGFVAANEALLPDAQAYWKSAERAEAMGYTALD